MLRVNIRATYPDRPPYETGFDWQGNKDEISDLMEIVEDAAYANKVTPEQFTRGTLKILPLVGVPTEPVARRGAMNAILWLVLQCPTAPSRPGIVADYAADEHIEVDIEMHDGEITLNLSSGPR